MVEPKITLLAVFFLMGVVQAIFFAAILVTNKKANIKANRYLALFILVFAADLFNEFLDHSLYGLEYIRLMILLSPTDFLYGPLIWLYTTAISSKRYAYKAKVLIHFLPTIVLAPLIWRYLLESDTFFSDLIVNNPELLDGNQIQPFLSRLVPGVTLIAIAQQGFYLYYSLRRLRTHSRRVSNVYSYLEGVNLSWLRTLIYGLVSVYILYIFRFLVAEIFDYVLQFDILLNIAIVIIIFAMAFFGIRQPRIYETTKDAEYVVADEKRTKYQKSALSESDMTRISEKLTQVMADELLYLDPNLTMPKLASHLSISANYLSQTLNSLYEENFFDYINRQRVDYAKQLLSDPAKESDSIIDIAMDSAFNSKSAFYSAFKKYAGMTPVQFRLSIGFK